jgi:hypothetical protein
MLLVRLLNPREHDVSRLPSIPASQAAMVTLLAVPLSPTKRQEREAPAIVLSSQVERTVSAVGTRILAKAPSGGGV